MPSRSSRKAEVAGRVTRRGHAAQRAEEFALDYKVSRSRAGAGKAALHLALGLARSSERSCAGGLASSRASRPLIARLGWRSLPAMKGICADFVQILSGFRLEAKRATHNPTNVLAWQRITFRGLIFPALRLPVFAGSCDTFCVPPAPFRLKRGRGACWDDSERRLPL